MATKQRKFKVGDRVMVMRMGTVEVEAPQEGTGTILYRVAFNCVPGFSTMCSPSDMKKIDDEST